MQDVGGMFGMQVASRILAHEGVRRFKCHAVLEGGSIHVDGEGCAHCKDAHLHHLSAPISTLMFCLEN